MNKTALAQKIKTLEGLSKEDKHNLLDLLNAKTYGLVWEDKPEAVEEELKTQLPILQEVTERKIISSRLLIDNNSQNTQPVKPQISLDFGVETDNSQTDSIVQNTAVLNTQNINHALIEGDNLHALTVLNYTHANKIDVIYIDPPYNTGNKDFKYNDSFVDKEDGYRHSKWLSFMAKRLRLAKNLLSDKGVIFISIDDNEQAQLKLLCDEVFGEDNFLNNIIWQKKFSPQNDAKYFSDNHDFILVYKKKDWKINLLVRNQDAINRYKNPDNDKRGVWTSGDVSVKSYNANYDYPITIPSGRPVNPPSGYCWRFSKEKFAELVTENRIWFGINGDGVPRYKRFLTDVKDGITPLTIWLHEEVGHNQSAKQEMKAILNDVPSVFDTPKPIKLIDRTLKLGSQKDSTILDFFAGSGTTLHAVMALNAEDGGSRQCILVTNNENNICEEVTYERNKRVIEGYTNAKGDFVAGLGGNNLRYYRTGYVGRERTIKNKKALMNLASEMLCLKEGVYRENSEKTTKQIRFFEENDKAFIIIYDEEYIDEAILLIQQIEIPNPIKVYIFANGQYPYTEDFEEVLDKIELCALPDAIYRAYQRLLPKEESITNV